MAGYWFSLILVLGFLIRGLHASAGDADPAYSVHNKCSRYLKVFSGIVYLEKGGRPKTSIEGSDMMVGERLRDVVQGCNE
ncbi:hypothetical protein HPP92_006238 [Vanilla planifolia]|uniref:Uncharacterized protein n=1 Tax=Vanilla planifolia TaxID=51239 RepID=A0A835RR28_VANPL|nr:hypothetical protein HPP92_006238 [Vanilla planifolia]